MVSNGIEINYMFQPVLMRMALWNLFVSATVLVISVIVANAFMTISIFIGIIIALINLAILAKTVKSGFLFRADKVQRFVMKRYYMRLIATILIISILVSKNLADPLGLIIGFAVTMMTTLSATVYISKHVPAGIKQGRETA